MTITTNHRGDLPKGRLLFLDDDADTCELMAILLEQAGYEVVIGSTVADGLQIVKSNQFDVILLDWQFEDGTGLDLCQTIRQTDTQTPIFFYTGMAYEHNIKTALRAGAQGCFIKPVEVGSMLEIISNYISPENPITGSNNS